LSTSKIPGYEILNYWTDIKIYASKNMNALTNFDYFDSPISLKPIIGST